MAPYLSSGVNICHFFLMSILQLPVLLPPHSQVRALPREEEDDEVSCSSFPTPLFGFLFHLKCLTEAHSKGRDFQSRVYSCLFKLFCWEKCPTVISNEKITKWEIRLTSCVLTWGCVGRVVIRAKLPSWTWVLRRLLKALRYMHMFHSLDWHHNSSCWMHLINHETGRLCHLLAYTGSN